MFLHIFGTVDLLFHFIYSNINYLFYFHFQIWWQGKEKTGDNATFGPNGSKVWDVKECWTLIYILHAHNHFTLLVGYTDKNRLEFYKSLKSDHYHQNICDSFVSIIPIRSLLFMDCLFACYYLLTVFLLNL